MEMDWRNVWWVRPVDSAEQHAVDGEPEAGVEVRTTTLCGQDVVVPVRPWFVCVDVRLPPLRCSRCAEAVRVAAGRPRRGAPREWVSRTRCHRR
jgi:hypothetical protein